MRKIALALVAALVVAGCSGSPTTPSADGGAFPPRSNGVMTPDTTVLTNGTEMQTAPALDTEADSAALARGGFTMGSGN